MDAISPVAITGFGCVSPLGIGLEETTKNLQASRDSISPVRLFSVEGCQSKTAGQVDLSLAERAASICPKARRWTRAAQMVLLAMEEALMARPDFIPDAVIMGTTSGGMALGEKFYRSLSSNNGTVHAGRAARNYVPHQPVLETMHFKKFNAPVRIVSNACASGTNALGMGCQMIRSGAARRVLVGGYDALVELVFAGFDCLRASTAEKCRPFDSERTGLALGEGAAVFCLEKSGADSPFVISGYGAATDTHHLTQPHPSGSGPFRTMRRAMEMAGITAAQIDYINAHGTGTPLNDSSEARAIAECCPNVPVSSTKGMTGHALGAAGAIEAAYCLLGMRDGFLPANINFRKTEEEFSLDIVANHIRPASPRRVLSNSFGFGGSNATVLLERRGA